METHGNYMIILLGIGVQFDFYKLIFESSKIELGQRQKIILNIGSHLFHDYLQ